MPRKLMDDTEVPGQRVNAEQLQMMAGRYHLSAQFSRGQRVLEVGCGPGLGLGYLVRQGAALVVGGEYSADSLRLAHRHYQPRERLELVRLDAHSLPFKDGSFDVVLLFEVIYYLSQPERFVAECHRILRQGGYLLLCLPNKDLPGFRGSAISTRYFSAPELASVLNRDFSVELFGAFPISSGAAMQRLRAALILAVSRILDILPGADGLRAFLNKAALGKGLVLPEEVGDEMPGGSQLSPIPNSSPDHRHQVLYAIARAR